jgi:hypothetical protein
MQQIRALLQSLEWWEFYDICEELVRVSGRPEIVAAEIETLFARENLPYRIDGDGIHWRLSDAAEDAEIQAVRLLVDRPELLGPAAQWAKARSHLAKRPPDPESYRCA